MPEPLQETQWSLVARAAGSEEESLRDLDALLRVYLPVLEAFLRRWPGLQDAQREDLLQGFVYQRILKQRLLEKATPERGRFRSFLFQSLKNYVRDHLRAEQAQRRQPEAGPPLPLEEARLAAEEDRTLARCFDQLWLRRLLEEAAEDMRLHCAKKGKDQLFRILQARVLAPALEDTEPMSYAELIEQEQIPSPSVASNLLITAKRMYRRHLEDRMRETLDSGEDLGIEWDWLMEQL